MQIDDLRLLGIPRSRLIIAIIYPYHDARSKDCPGLSAKVNSLNASVLRACGPEHLRASQTCYCPYLPATSRMHVPLRSHGQWRSLTRLFSRQGSRSLTELTRQITPPTKNGHAPPPIESRKSSQSVNPHYVWTW